MLNRSPLLALSILKKRKETNFFTYLPKDILHQISQFIEAPNSDFAAALHHVAYGELDKAKALLDMNPRLVFFAGTAVTPSGLTIKRTTLLECALGAGDFEMATMIMPYFSGFDGGEGEKKRQLARYQVLIKDMFNQKPDALKWLIDIVKKSSAEDVSAELATGEKYDGSYQSELRTALNKFREQKLDPKVRVITKPRMHCNYQNLRYAYYLINIEWVNLRKDKWDNHETFYEKIHLVSQQIIGFIQLVELPAYERYLFARGQVKEATEGKKIERSFQYKKPTGSFPCYNSLLINSRSGVGFDSLVGILGEEWRARNGWGASAHIFLLDDFYQAKASNLNSLYSKKHLDVIKSSSEGYKETLQNAETNGPPIQAINPLNIIENAATKLNKPSTQQQSSSNSKDHELFEACKNCCAVDVKRLLDEGVNPNIRDTIGNTPLFYSALNTDFDSANHLCTAGANINQKNHNGETPLIYVCQKCSSEIPLQLLLSHGANPYIPSRSGRTVFALAKDAHRILELGILKEWEIDNPEIAEKLKLEAEKLEKDQALIFTIATKLFLSSPVHTMQALSPIKEDKISSTTESGQKNINLACGHLQIIFKKESDASWLLKVINNEKSVHEKYSMFFSSKESINKIQKYLHENDISEFIEFIEPKGVSAKEISEYLRKEMKKINSNKLKF